MSTGEDPLKGFYISVKNDLLEPKHRKAMGEALWLYLWLLDRMTSVSERGYGLVLGGKPIAHPEVNEDLDVPERTYHRWVARLRKAGYINTVRAPQGLVIGVHKASKKFKDRPAKSGVSSDKPNMAGESSQKRQDRPATKGGSDRPKSAERPATLVGSNKTLSRTTTEDTSAKADGAKALEVKKQKEPVVEITKLVEHFELTFGIPKMVGEQRQRRAARVLLLRCRKQLVESTGKDPEDIPMETVLRRAAQAIEIAHAAVLEQFSGIKPNELAWLQDTRNWNKLMVYARTKPVQGKKPPMRVGKVT